MSLRVTAEQLCAVMRSLREADAKRYVEPLNLALAWGEVHTVPRVAAFLGQVAVESMELRRWEEKLSYTAQRMAQVWPSRFRGPDGKPTRRAYQLQGDARGLALEVYSYRMGNGGPETGDGWAYRGRGPIQVTGRENYTACAAATSLRLLERPETLLEPGPGFLAAAWFWRSRGLNELAEGGIEAVPRITKRVNGGHHGLEGRIEATRRAYRALG